MSDPRDLDDLDQRGREAATDLRNRAAARPVPTFDAERPIGLLAAPTGARRPATRRPMYAVAAAAVLALLATGLWVGTRDDGNDTADEVVASSIRPYLPTVVPDGMELAGVAESDGTGDPEVSFEYEVGPLNTFGPAMEDPRLAVFASSEHSFGGDEGSVPDRSEDDAPQEVAVGDRTGYVLDNGTLPGIVLEVPVHDDGPVIVLFGRDRDVEQLVGVAAATTVDGLDVTVAADGLPAGWRLLDTDPDGMLLGSPMGALAGSLHTRSASGHYFDSGRERQLVVSSAARPASSVHTQRLFLDAAETVTVRGHEAVLGRHPFDPAADAWVLRWSERPGEVLSVSGYGLDADELLAVAESLQPVDQARWQELLEATALFDLAPDDFFPGPFVELGRGRFPDGTAWVLRYGPERTDGDGLHSETLELTVALTGDSSSGTESSHSGFGTSIDDDGNPIETPAEVFRSTHTLEQGGRTFGAGLVRDDVARVEVRSTDGTVEDAQLVTAESKVAWVLELGSEGTTLVAFAADGTELGSHELTVEGGDGEVWYPAGSTIPHPGPGEGSDSGSETSSDSGSSIGSETGSETEPATTAGG